MRRWLEEHELWGFFVALSVACTLLIPLIGLANLARVFVSVGRWGDNVVERGLPIAWPALVVFAWAGFVVWARNVRFRIRVRGWGSTGQVMLAATFLALVIGSAIVLPARLVSWDIGEGLSPLDRSKAINDVRSTLLQAVAGLLLTAGAIATWRQLRIAREGQITERFTRAVDQLGSQEMDIRLGGIYALERIARDSPSDLFTITEVLTAFVRGHAPWPPKLPGQYRADVPLEKLPGLRERAADVQAAISVLARRWLPRPEEFYLRLNIEAADLRKVALFGADLKYAVLSGTHLEGADLRSADLEGANLNNTDLREAILSYARLREAHLRDANLEGTNLHGVQGLGEADLNGATASPRTDWPFRFDWLRAGVTLRD